MCMFKVVIIFSGVVKKFYCNFLRVILLVFVIFLLVVISLIWLVRFGFIGILLFNLLFICIVFLCMFNK